MYVIFIHKRYFACLYYKLQFMILINLFQKFLEAYNYIIFTLFPVIDKAMAAIFQ